MLQHKTILLDNGFRVGVTTAGDHLGALLGDVPVTPLVFLHGLGVSAPAYSELLELLATHGFAVTALDAADHGRSDSLPLGHTIADMADITARALDQLGITQAVMVGHSMGGAMVTEFAARHPERVLAAILLDAAAGEYHHHAIRVDASPATGLRAAQFAAGLFRDVVADGIRAWRVRSPKQQRNLASRLRKALSGPDCMRAILALTKHDTTPLLRAMRRYGVRTAVLHGTRDGIVSLAAAFDTARIAGAKLHVIDGGYHSWMLSDPVLGVDMIRYALHDLEWQGLSA